jgi:hypothetical protein
MVKLVSPEGLARGLFGIMGYVYWFSQTTLQRLRGVKLQLFLAYPGVCSPLLRFRALT